MNKLILLDYEELRDGVLRELAEGKERARQAVEREKVVTYHRVGQLIDTHVLRHKDRADYGAQVVEKLAEDVGLGKRVLYETLQFYRAFRNVRAGAQLGWTHYRVLMRVESREERKYFAQRAEVLGWSSRELSERIAAGVLPVESEMASAGRAKPLRALRGDLYTYRIIAARTGAGVRLDVGFGTHLEVEGLEGFGVGQVVRVEKIGGYSFQAVNKRVRCYSYRARVDRVIDGDTLWVDIDCGFGVWSYQKVRLRGLDTSELNTREGETARHFVSELLVKDREIALTTTKPDKYDRYLGDVFYGEGNAQEILKAGMFLNREILDRGLAVRV